jgi:hypothetical protein
VEAMNYSQANAYAITLLIFALMTLSIVYFVNASSRIKKVI